MLQAGRLRHHDSKLTKEFLKREKDPELRAVAIRVLIWHFETSLLFILLSSLYFCIIRIIIIFDINYNILVRVENEHKK